MKVSSVVRWAVLASVMLLFCGLAIGETHAPPLRLAVIAEGGSAECRNLADLLQVELSKRDDLELVEREEIDRVLAEQALTASGLVAESARIQLGAILKAKGLLFVGQTNPTNGVFQVRLVETTHGFVAGFIVHEATTPLSQTQAAVDRATANLSLPPDEQVGVSMLVINNGLPRNLKTRPIVQEFMEGIEQRVMVELASMPGTLILERRKLDDVAREDDLTGKASSFMAGTLLIDGGLNPAADLTAEKDDPPIVLTLRLRNLATGTTKIVKVEGGLLSLRSLEQKALSDLVGVALEMRAEAGTGTLKAEVKILDDLVKRYQLSWASEAAFAIDASDKKRVRTHALMLSEQIENLPDDRARAITLAKVEVLCREHGISLTSLWSLRGTSEGTVLKYLKQPETFLDLELYRLLQPLRKTLLSEFERQALQVQSPLSFDTCVKWLPGIVALPSERRAHLQNWVQKLQANPKTSEDMKYFLSTYVLYVYRWKIEDLMRFRSSDDLVSRFHANRVLMRDERSRKARIEYSDAMMADLDAYLARTKGIDPSWRYLHTGSGVAVNGKRYTPNRWPSESLRDIYFYRPKLKELVQRKFFERMKSLLEEKDFRTIAVLDYDLMLSTIPERELFDWMTAIVEQKEQNWETFELIPDMKRWRAEILTRHPEFLKGNKLKERVLVSALTDGERLKKLMRPKEKAEREMTVLFQRILVDGDTLWVGLTSRPVDVLNGERQWFNLLGVLEIDLVDGHVKSERSRWFPGDTASFTTRFELGGMVRVGDYLAMLHPGVGVFAIPIRETDMAGGRLLGFEEGLPTQDNHASSGFSGSLVGMREGVCLGLKQWIVYWDFDTWKSRILLDVEDSATTLGYDDKAKYIRGLTSNSQTDEMWLNLAGSEVGIASNVRSFYCKGLSGNWEGIEKEDLPPPSEVDQKLDQARQLLKDAMVSDIREVAVWRDKIIVLYGSGSDTWKVSEFSPVENGGENEK